MHFEGIFEAYFETIATGSNNPVASVSSKKKMRATETSGLVQINLVESGFQSFSGPHNWTLKH